MGGSHRREPEGGSQGDNSIFLYGSEVRRDQPTGRSWLPMLTTLAATNKRWEHAAPTLVH